MSTLDELEALLAKATPGEWSYSGPHEEQGEWWIASPSERKDIPWSREDAALIAASRNHLGELLRIARAVASREAPVRSDRWCYYCGGDEAKGSFGHEQNHAPDCAYVAARKLSGGGT